MARPWARALSRARLLARAYRYGGYIDAKTAQPDTLPLFKAPWPEQNLTQGNGPLMARYMLYGDGKVYENEPERFQFGKHARLDWGLEGMPAMQFERGDFMAEGDSMTYIPLLPFGLRGIDDPDFDTLLGRMFHDGRPDADAPTVFAAISTPADDNPNPYLRAYQEDFAARAQWCAHDPAACSHPAHVVEAVADRSAVAGERVALAATIVDPDDKGFDAHWDVAVDPSSYAGAQDCRCGKNARRTPLSSCPPTHGPAIASRSPSPCRHAPSAPAAATPRSPSPSRSNRRRPHSARSVPRRRHRRYEQDIKHWEPPA